MDNISTKWLLCVQEQYKNTGVVVDLAGGGNTTSAVDMDVLEKKVWFYYSGTYMLTEWFSASKMNLMLLSCMNPKNSYFQTVW